MNQPDYPDNQIRRHTDDYLYAVIPGFKYVIKVFSKSQDKYIGWMGYNSFSIGENTPENLLKKFPKQ